MKLTSPHRHFHTLIAFAHSPRLRLAFQSKISIIAIPTCPPRAFGLPRKMSEWRRIISDIIPTVDVRVQGANVDWRTTEAWNAYNRFGRRQRWSAPIHCECALIQYMTTRSDDAKRARWTRKPSKRRFTQILSGEGTEGRKSPIDFNPVFVQKSCIHDSDRSATSNNLTILSRHERRQILDIDSTKANQEDDTNTTTHANPSRWTRSCKANPSKRKSSREHEEKDGTKKKRNWEVMDTESDVWDSVPPFSYIGVSKLSCRACQMWIQCYNAQGGREYYTRGSHGKWYWPWGMPQLKEEALSESMVKMICTAYREHCRALHRLKSLSDGSTAASRPPSPPDPLVDSFVNSYFLRAGI